MTDPLSQPRTVHWRINCLCDTKCSFCYGPDALHEVDPEVCIPVLEKMIGYGIETFVITGGEPLLSKRIDRVLRYLHANGVKVVLYTNCTYWDFHEETLLECVDTLCVPIEGASEMVHDAVRGFNSMRAIQSVLDRYAVADGPFTVRAGTVVGRHNLNELPAIGYMLDNYQLEYWALYQHPRYTDRVLAKYFKENQLAVSLAEYEVAVASALARPDGTTQIRVASELARESNFFMMSPELEIVVPLREESGALSDKILCDAKEAAVPEIVSLWQESVDWQRYSQNLMISL